MHVPPREAASAIVRREIEFRGTADERERFEEAMRGDELAGESLQAGEGIPWTESPVKPMRAASATQGDSGWVTKHRGTKATVGDMSSLVLMGSTVGAVGGTSSSTNPNAMFTSIKLGRGAVTEKEAVKYSESDLKRAIRGRIELQVWCNLHPLVAFELYKAWGVMIAELLKQYLEGTDFMHFVTDREHGDGFGIWSDIENMAVVKSTQASQEYREKFENAIMDDPNEVKRGFEMLAAYKRRCRRYSELMQDTTPLGLGETKPPPLFNDYTWAIKLEHKLAKRFGPIKERIKIINDLRGTDGKGKIDLKAKEELLLKYEAGEVHRGAKPFTPPDRAEWRWRRGKKGQGANAADAADAGNGDPGGKKPREPREWSGRLTDRPFHRLMGRGFSKPEFAWCLARRSNDKLKSFCFDCGREGTCKRRKCTADDETARKWCKEGLPAAMKRIPLASVAEIGRRKWNKAIKEAKRTAAAATAAAAANAGSPSEESNSESESEVRARGKTNSRGRSSSFASRTPRRRTESKGHRRARDKRATSSSASSASRAKEPPKEDGPSLTNSSSARSGASRERGGGSIPPRASSAMPAGHSRWSTATSPNRHSGEQGLTEVGGSGPTASSAGGCKSGEGHHSGNKAPKVRPVSAGNPHGFWWDQPGAGKRMYKMPKNPVDACGTIVIKKGGDNAAEREQRSAQRAASSWEDIKARREPMRDAATEKRYREHRRQLRVKGKTTEEAILRPLRWRQGWLEKGVAVTTNKFPCAVSAEVEHFVLWVKASEGESASQAWQRLERELEELLRHVGIQDTEGLVVFIHGESHRSVPGIAHAQLYVLRDSATWKQVHAAADVATLEQIFREEEEYDGSSARAEANAEGGDSDSAELPELTEFVDSSSSDEESDGEAGYVEVDAPPLPDDRSTPQDLPTCLACPSTLFLIRMEVSEARRSPTDARWTVGQTAHLRCLHNVAAVRVGQDSDKLTIADLVEAAARARGGQFAEVRVTNTLMAGIKHHCGASVNSAMKILKTPRSVQSTRLLNEHGGARRLLEGYRSRACTKPNDKVFVSLMCGVSGDALAFRGLGGKEENMHLFEACPEHCATLRQVFPKAHVYQGSVLRPKVRRKLRKLAKKGVHITVVALLCQASSKAATVHDPADPRLSIGQKALELGLGMKPEVLVAENVWSFESEQKDAYRLAKDTIAKAFAGGHVMEVKVNAKHAMDPTQRNRLFMIGSRVGHLDDLAKAETEQRKLRAAGVPTCPTPKQRLKEYMDLRGKEWIFIPNLKGAERGPDGRAKRTASINHEVSTITGNYGWKGSIMQHCFDKYVMADADPKDKSKVACLPPWAWGLLQGFPAGYPWSKRRHCDCVGCAKAGKKISATRHVGDVARGQVITTGTALFVLKHVVRRVTGRRDAGGVASTAAGGRLTVGGGEDKDCEPAKKDKKKRLGARRRHKGSGGDKGKDRSPVGGARGKGKRRRRKKGRKSSREATRKDAGGKHVRCADKRKEKLKAPKEWWCNAATQQAFSCPCCGATTEKTPEECVNFLKGIVGECSGADAWVELEANAVSDGVAKERLRVAHQRLGHASLDTVRGMHHRGASLGLEGLSKAQLMCNELRCKTCMRALQLKRPHRRKKKKSCKPKWESLRINDEVMVDLEGPHTPSLLTKGGERAPGKHKGANRYTVFYVERKTERIFPSYIRNKSQLEKNVEDMAAHLTIEARDSVDYDGKTDLHVKTWVSDRDSNLTSKKAVAFMLKGRMKHVMTAADSPNQTPLLDNLMRRAKNVCRALLDQAGLPIEFWELAMTVACAIVNVMPTASHPEGHSAMQRWTGEEPDISTIRTFGSEVYPVLEVGEGGREDKLEAMAKDAGTGRYRLVSVSDRETKGLGVVSKGAAVLDTDTGRIRVVRNCKLNEVMEEVREMPKPKGAWDENELGERDLPDDVEPPEEKEMEVEEKVDFVDLPMSEVDEGEQKRGKNPQLSLEQPIAVRQENPKLRGSKCWRRYNRYRAARTVGEYLQLGGTRADLRHDLERGFINVTPNCAWSAGWLQPDPLLNRAHCRQHRTKSEETEALEKLAYEALEADFHRARKEKGVEVPAGVGASVRNMAFWEANAAATRKSMERMATVQELARQVAMWSCIDKHPRAKGKFQTKLVDKYKSELASWAGEVHEAMLEEHLETLAQELKPKSAVGDAPDADQEWAEYAANLVKGLEGKRASEIPTPASFKSAMRGTFGKYWQDAIAKEIANLKEHEVFTWVPRPPDRNIIDSTWAWKVKPDENGFISRFKARLAARGFKQIYGIDFVDSMAPVGKLVTFRVLLAECAHRGMSMDFVDIRSAYLKAELGIKQHMEAPEGVSPPSPGMVMRLDRALYGLCNAGREWHKLIHSKMIEWGFKVSAADPCLYTRWTKDRKTVQRVLLFVDDMAIFADRTAAGTELREQLVKGIEEAGFEYSKDDAADHYLGMRAQIVGEHKTRVFLSQTRYIEDVQRRFEMEDCKPAYAPSMSGKVLVRDCWGHAKGKEEPCIPGQQTSKGGYKKNVTAKIVPEGVNPADNPYGRRYREMCGVLRWIEQCTRPDISATLSELCKVQINPGEEHVKRMDHLMRYVFTTKGLGLMYGGTKPGTANGILTAHTDADWCGDELTKYSRGGWVVSSWGTPVNWASFKLKAIAASSCESEYMAMSKLAREARWLRYLMSDLGYGDLRVTDYGKFCQKDYAKVRLSDLVDRNEKPMLCMGDNKGANAMSENPVLHGRTKHIHISYHLVRHEVQKGHLAFVYINTKENVADMMTKGLPKVTHEYLVAKIMNRLGPKGEVQNVKGEDLAHDEKLPVKDKLYGRKPLGLFPSWKNEDPRRRDKRSWSVAPIQSHVPAAGMAVSLNAEVSADVRHALKWAEGADTNTLRGVVGECFLSLALDGSLELGSVAAKCLAQAMGVEDITRAIIDSGASFTYVAGGVKLSNARPGSESVRVANNALERVSEVGDLGPIKGAKKVRSFNRTLVSVTDLVEQFGRVIFDSDGVKVETKRGPKSKRIRTVIGTPTLNRLYKFDQAALQNHADRIVGRAMAATAAEAA